MGIEVDSMVMLAVERRGNEGSEEFDSRVWTWRRKHSRSERMCCLKKKGYFGNYLAEYGLPDDKVSMHMTC